MRVAIRKLRVEDVEKLQALVVENFDAIEPGLTVLDARLLLGHATIDVIGVDAAGALVLGNVGFSANEEMLLKAVEAYSWCLEYPEALVRLYPSCPVSDDRPPRLLFVVERMPDAFHRKIKQLGFPEVDCVEFRHLEFDGVPAVYFESLLRLRRGAVSRSGQSDAPVSAPSTPSVVPGAVLPRATGMRLPKTQPGADAPVSSPRAAERRAPSREPAAVVSMVTRQATVAAPWTERAPQTEPVALREPEPVVVEPVAAEPLAVEPLVAAVAPPAPEPTPVVAGPEIVPTPAPAPKPEPVVPQLTSRPTAVDTVPSMAPGHVLTNAKQPERVSFKELADSLLGAMTATQEALAQTTVDATTKAAIDEPLVLESAVKAPAPSEPVEAPLTLELETPVAKAAEPTAMPQPMPTSPAIEELVAQATEALDAKTAPALTVETANPAPAPAAPERPITETGKPAAPAMPQGFEGLKFPNDGVLTRQWMEFLSQMSTTK
jgi:hypothetical protein